MKKIIFTLFSFMFLLLNACSSSLNMGTLLSASSMSGEMGGFADASQNVEDSDDEDADYYVGVDGSVNEVDVIESGAIVEGVDSYESSSSSEIESWFGGSATASDDGEIPLDEYATEEGVDTGTAGGEEFSGSGAAFADATEESEESIEDAETAPAETVSDDYAADTAYTDATDDAAATGAEAAETDASAETGTGSTDTSGNGATDEGDDDGKTFLSEPITPEDLDVTIAKEDGEGTSGGNNGSGEEMNSEEECDIDNVGNIALLESGPNAAEDLSAFEDEGSDELDTRRSRTSGGASHARRSHASRKTMRIGFGGENFGIRSRARQADVLAYDIVKSTGWAKVPADMELQTVYFLDAAALSDDDDADDSESSFSKCEELIDEGGISRYEWVEMDAQKLSNYEVETGSFSIRKNAVSLNSAKGSGDSVRISETAVIRNFATDQSTFTLKAEDFSLDANTSATPYVIIRKIK